MNEMISVVIPTYNRRDLITRCIQSVLTQTYSNIEVIVVDDASTDKTYELFEEIIDERVSFYRYEENQGACFARNYGVDRAKGQYIAFQDSDDEWHSNKLVMQLEYMKKQNVDFVFCGMNRVEPGASMYYPVSDFDEKGNILEQLLTDNVISTQTMMMKHEVLNAVRFDTTFKRFQDWDFALQVTLHKFKIAYLQKALVESTVQSNSISVNSKLGMAYEHLFEKYMVYYDMYPHAKANLYMYQARGYRQVDYRTVCKYLWLSLRTEWNSKTALKLILSILHLWK